MSLLWPLRMGHVDPGVEVRGPVLVDVLPRRLSSLSLYPAFPNVAFHPFKLPQPKNKNQKHILNYVYVCGLCGLWV